MDGSGARLLLVEDNPGDARLIEEMLREVEGAPFELDWRDRLSGALERLEEGPVDVVLLDLSLPDAQGLATFQELYHRARSVPIVVLTGLRDEALAARAVNEGAQDYLAKSQLNPELLVRSLRYAMDRHHREAALRESEALFRLMADSAPMMLWLADGDGRATFFNRTWLDFTGRGLEDELEDGWVASVHPEDRPHFRKAFQEARAHRGLYQTEYRLRRHDGQYRSVLETGAPRLAPDGRLLGFIGSCLDIHERKASEEALRQSQKLESLGLLAGGIAHDFNNLLSAMLGNLELAEMEVPDDSPARVFLANVQAAALRAADLTRQLLAYSGKGHFVVRPLDLNVVVREITQLLGVSIPKKARLAFDLQEKGLPPVQGDAAQVHQVVMNLVTNAAEALSPEGGTITLRTRVREVGAEEATDRFPAFDLRPGSYVALTVEDTGMGMTPETMGRIFDPFYSTKFTGRGLGLSTILGILKGHRGGLHLESELGKGSCFEVVLPALPAQDAARVAPREAPAWRGSGTVLLADDESVVRDVTGALLRSLGFEVVEAARGEEALERFRQHRDAVAVAILDLTMPGLDGLETAEAILREDPGATIVLASGYGPEESGDRFRGSGISAFLQKPFRRADLVRVLQEVMERKGMPKSP